MPGVALWLPEGDAVGAITTVVGWLSDLHATKTSTKAIIGFMRADCTALVFALTISCAPAHVPLVLETTHGTIRCELDREHAPRAVEQIQTLASRGHYDGLAFFRVIPGVLVQTGSRTNDGSNGSLPRIAVESDSNDAARLAKPGALLLARYTHPPDRVDPDPPRGDAVIGAQIVIGLVSMSHLAGQVTVVGACGDLDVAQRISETRGARVIRASER